MVTQSEQRMAGMSRQYLLTTQRSYIPPFIHHTYSIQTPYKPHTNPIITSPIYPPYPGNEAFEGFAIDLLKAISDYLGFRFKLYTVPDREGPSRKLLIFGTFLELLIFVN